MSTCSIAYGIGKDSNANFINQLRDASDVTRMLRQQGTKRNYQVLSASAGKNQSPVGGIPLTNLLDMAHTTQSYGPSNALLSGRGYVTPQCTSCGTTTLTPFSTLKVSLSLIRY